MSGAVHDGKAAGWSMRTRSMSPLRARSCSAAQSVNGVQV
jgi:hypothetical protein